ncbi:acyltransferase [Mucilaginibacter sp. AW1-3]
MKKKLVLYLLKKLPLFVYYYQRKKMEEVRSQPNVSIHDSFFLGDHSEIKIGGSCKELTIAEGVSVLKFCNFLIYPAGRLQIGANVFFNNYCSVSCLGNIEIGENTMFGEGVKIYDHNHAHHYDNGTLKVEKSEFKTGSVKIGKDCWIGSNVTILNNVEIGDNVIVGAHCLIYKSIPANSIVKHAENLIITEKP